MAVHSLSPHPRCRDWQFDPLGDAGGSGRWGPPMKGSPERVFVLDSMDVLEHVSEPPLQTQFFSTTKWGRVTLFGWSKALQKALQQRCALKLLAGVRDAPGGAKVGLRELGSLHFLTRPPLTRRLPETPDRTESQNLRSGAGSSQPRGPRPPPPAACPRAAVHKTPPRLPQCLAVSVDVTGRTKQSTFKAS